MRAALLFLLVAACGPIKPEPDSGSPPPAEAGAKDTGSPACVGDYGGCVPGAQTCCTPGYTCSTSTHVCQAPCTPINGLCSDNSECCSGICNGTCQ